jgi:IS30 family transposase
MNKHLQKEERIKMQTLLDAGKSIDDISVYLNRHRSTIYREMNRAGIEQEGYSAELYHIQSRVNMIRNQNDNIPSESTIRIIEKLIIQEQWSPEQISNWLRIQGHETVSHSWIYQYIARDKAGGGELSNHLRRGGSYQKGPKEYRGKIPNRVPIEQRPEIVTKRTRLGDYEIDLIVGPKNKGSILTVVDRVSRECTIRKLANKSASELESIVSQAIKGDAHTITSDNGTEFTNHQSIAKSLNIQYFFANPYASYERGSIENLNGLIRQYIPKGKEFDDIEQNELDIIQNKLNNRPRKVLAFLSPIEYRDNYNVINSQ